jgi:hypothetical protein
MFRTVGSGGTQTSAMGKLWGFCKLGGRSFALIDWYECDKSVAHKHPILKRWHTTMYQGRKVWFGAVPLGDLVAPVVVFPSLYEDGVLWQFPALGDLLDPKQLPSPDDLHV